MPGIEFLPLPAGLPESAKCGRRLKKMKPMEQNCQICDNTDCDERFCPALPTGTVEDKDHEALSAITDELGFTTDEFENDCEDFLGIFKALSKQAGGHSESDMMIFISTIEELSDVQKIAVFEFFNCMKNTKRSGEELLRAIFGL